jgi:hypothetical protein
MARHIHVHVGKTKDAQDPKLIAAHRDALSAIEDANRKCAALRRLLKDQSDRDHVMSAESSLLAAKAKIKSEVLRAYHS